MNLLAELAIVVESNTRRLDRTRRDERNRKVRLQQQAEEGAPWVPVVIAALPGTVYKVAEVCGVHRTNAYKRLAALRACGKVKRVNKEWRVHDEE